MTSLDRDILFVALTRPQMLFGVTYGYLIANGVLITELFLIFRSPWVVAAALILHVAGVLACLRDPRMFDLWRIKLQRCPRLKSFRIWGCNSYRG